MPCAFADVKPHHARARLAQPAVFLYVAPRAVSRRHLERWPRGRRRRFAKPLYGPKAVSRVRIPPSPQRGHYTVEYREVMMNRMWLGAVAVLALVGCGGGGGGGRALTEVDWIDGNAAPVSIDPGYSDCVQYGGSIPPGAQVFFDIYDALDDNMDASVVPAIAACDGSTGYGLVASWSWNGTLSGRTGAL